MNRAEKFGLAGILVVVMALSAMKSPLSVSGIFTSTNDVRPATSSTAAVVPSSPARLRTDSTPAAPSRPSRARTGTTHVAAPSGAAVPSVSAPRRERGEYEDGE